MERPLAHDDRGFFSKIFKSEWLKDQNFSVEDINYAMTFSPGTVRGMHLQKAPFGEQKFITCVSGEIFDVVIDLRAQSSTFGDWAGFELTEENRLSLLVPKGFAHGYMALSKNAIVCYASSSEYKADSELIVSPQNSIVGIEWPFAIALQSEKDLLAPVDLDLPQSGY